MTTLTADDMTNLRDMVTEVVDQRISKSEVRADAKFATKEDLQQFATKADLGRSATKEDLKDFTTKADLKDALKPIHSDIHDIKISVNRLDRKFEEQVVPR